MASKMIILLYMFCKQPHCDTVSLITQSVSMDTKDNYYEVDLYNLANRLMYGRYLMNTLLGMVYF